ncbi:3149_t:CDS:2 [Entrophospora sp. SA101]|nr:3149_t:CDS:2 [Entrophospora sp. SA101]
MYNNKEINYEDSEFDIEPGKTIKWSIEYNSNNRHINIKIQKKIDNEFPTIDNETKEEFSTIDEYGRTLSEMYNNKEINYEDSEFDIEPGKTIKWSIEYNSNNRHINIKIQKKIDNEFPTIDNETKEELSTIDEYDTFNSKAKFNYRSVSKGSRLTIFDLILRRNGYDFVSAVRAGLILLMLFWKDRFIVN